MIITIDGPSASGKSSAARVLAEKLNFYYLSTGMLFRALAYELVITCGYTVEQLENPATEDILELCKDIRYCYDVKRKEHVFFKEQDITKYLKTRDGDDWSSRISRHPVIRAAIVTLQREIAQEQALVIDGRDCGSIVFPSADYKFFLTASVEVRAQRWIKDQERLGNHITVQEAEEAIRQRDDRDMHREHSPLVVPEGAIIIDNSSLSLERTIELMLTVILK